MKMYTSPEQTAKLIELGFEKPSSIASVEPIYGMGGISVAKAYSIGELIEMLPKHTGDSDILHIEAYDSIGWDVWYGCYCNGDEVRVKYSTENKELIDAIYAMILQLKEEEVI